MENILVSLSNLPAFYPIFTALNNNDYLTSILLINVTRWSILSHLFENHKHGMPGLYLSKSSSYILNRLDVLGVILLVSRLIFICYPIIDKILYKFYPYLLSSIIFNLVSENDKYNVNKKWIYIPTHIIWHISVYLLMDYVLMDVYSQN